MDVHSHIGNNKINRLRGKRLQLICKDKQSSFHEVLEEKVVSQYMNETYVSLQEKCLIQWKVLYCFGFVKVTSAESHRYKCRRRHQVIYRCRLLLWYKHLHVKKNPREQLYRGRANFLPLSNLPGSNFLGDTIPGGNFSAGNIPCSEYKQDYFLVRVGATIKD